MLELSECLWFCLFSTGSWRSFCSTVGSSW